MAEEAGYWKVEFANAEEINPTKVLEISTREVSNLAKAFPKGEEKKALPHLPRIGQWLDENSRMILSFKSLAADIIESEECNGTLGVILKNKKTGVLSRKTLVLGDEGIAGDTGFTGFIGTIDISVITTAYARIGYWECPRGFEATFDPQPKLHMFAGDDT